MTMELLAARGAEGCSLAPILVGVLDEYRALCARPGVIIPMMPSLDAALRAAASILLSLTGSAMLRAEVSAANERLEENMASLANHLKEQRCKQTKPQ